MEFKDTQDSNNLYVDAVADGIVLDIFEYYTHLDVEQTTKLRDYLNICLNNMEIGDIYE